ncbi:hypothetical protein [Bacillus pseudomycoides]|nr:hypothetical protein [Bacillus pseudomycoides]
MNEAFESLKGKHVQLKKIIARLEKEADPSKLQLLKQAKKELAGLEM